MRHFSAILLCVVLFTAALPVEVQSNTSIRILVDSKPLTAAAVNVDGRLLVPMRALFTALGATVGWDPAARMVKAIRGGRTLRLVIGSQIADLDGRPVSLAVPAQIIAGSTYVPVRFAAEVLGAEVAYDDDTRTVTITTEAPTPAPVKTPVAVPGDACNPFADFGRVQAVEIMGYNPGPMMNRWGFSKDNELWLPAEWVTALGSGLAWDESGQSLALSGNPYQLQLPDRSTVRGPLYYPLQMGGSTLPDRAALYLGRWWLPLPALAERYFSPPKANGIDQWVLRLQSFPRQKVVPDSAFGPNTIPVAMIVNGSVICERLPALDYFGQPLVPAHLLANLGADVRYDGALTIASGTGKIDLGAPSYPAQVQAMSARANGVSLRTGVYWAGLPWISLVEAAQALGWQTDWSGRGVGLRSVAVWNPKAPQQVNDLFTQPAGSEVERAAAELALYEVFWRLPGMPYAAAAPADPAVVKEMADRMGVPFSVPAGTTWSDTVLAAHKAYVASGVAAARGHKWWEKVQVWGKDTIDHFQGAYVSPEQEAALITETGLSANAWVQVLPDHFAHRRRKAAQFHRAGVWYSAQLMTTLGYVPDHSQRNVGFGPDITAAGILDARCTDIGGEPMANASMGQGWYLMASESAGWYNYLLRYFQSTIDSGADVILMDNAEGSSYQAQGCFQPESMAAFRTHLQQKYSATQLQAKGIRAISTFDYRQFLLDGGYGPQLLAREHIIGMPLGSDYLEWSLISQSQMLTRLVRDLKEYARIRHGREVAFTANAGPFNRISYPVLAPFDYVSYELFYTEAGWPPARSAAAAQYALRSFGKAGRSLLSMQSAYDLAQRQKTAGLLQLLVADAYANLGAFFVPFRVPGQDLKGSGQRADFTGDLAAVAPYYKFARAHPEAYEGLQPAAQLGLLYLLENAEDYDAPGYRGAVNLLGETQTQFAVVFGADTPAYRRPLAAADLAPHTVLWLDGSTDLTPAQSDPILAWVRSGGTLLVTGRLPAGLTAGPLGGGRIIHEAGELGRTYLTSPSADLRQRWLRLLATAGVADQAVATGAPPTLGVYLYRHREGGRQVAHLVNYDYRRPADRVVPTGPFTLRLPVTGSSATLLTPAGDERRLTARREGGLLVVPVPDLTVWGVILIQP